MNDLVYFKQKHPRACSLVILRMVLNKHGISVTEEDLVEKVEKNYGKHFENIWNPTIAKLAREYGLETTMYALWPLFKPSSLDKALKEYKDTPTTFCVAKYEHKKDQDILPEPLPLAYKEMFKAIELGCHAVYGRLTERRIKTFLRQKKLIQTSIKLKVLYPHRKGFHSILIYAINKDSIQYHDPYYGPALEINIATLLKATGNTGAAILYG
ncbi:MAG: hypothetical protein HY817_04995 [Candidatus Abawacabacteria bacterium]|nr:hypothetical protein [Candidatus Abawacabacteria bacterium]